MPDQKIIDSAFTLINCILISIVLITLCALCPARRTGTAHNDEEICQAIFRAEGGFSAKYLYGIRSVHYANIREAKAICKKTIANNRRRYIKTGGKTEEGFLSFLGRRYCPTRSEGDQQGVIWLKNVKYFLGKEVRP